MSAKIVQDLVAHTHDRQRHALMSSVQLLDTTEDRVGLAMALAMLTLKDITDILEDNGVRRISMLPLAQRLSIIGTAFAITINRQDYNRIHKLRDADFQLIMQELSDLLQPLIKEIQSEIGKDRRAG